MENADKNIFLSRIVERRTDGGFLAHLEMMSQSLSNSCFQGYDSSIIFLEPADVSVRLEPVVVNVQSLRWPNECSFFFWNEPPREK